MLLLWLLLCLSCGGRGCWRGGKLVIQPIRPCSILGVVNLRARSLTYFRPERFSLAVAAATTAMKNSEIRGATKRQRYWLKELLKRLTTPGSRQQAAVTGVQCVTLVLVISLSETSIAATKSRSRLLAVRFLSSHFTFFSTVRQSTLLYRAILLCCPRFYSCHW